MTGRGGSGLGKRGEALALRQGKFVLFYDCGRTAAGLLFLIDDFVQAAVLEHDALAGLYVVIAAFKDTGD